MSERVVLPLLLALICLLNNSFESEAFASSKLFLTESRTRSKIIEKSFIREDCVTVLNLGAGNDAQSSNSDDEEEEEDPLALGIDAVRWLPSVKEKQVKESSNSNDEDVEILPLFPLGVHTPQSNQILNIFEPRYRQMYNDILMNGSKRFVVTMCHPTERGKFAQVGVMFELEDLKEVSELTADQVKYICDHRVTDRVKVHRIINPEAWESRETYLQVEATRLKEDDELEEPSTKNAGIMDLFRIGSAAKTTLCGTEEETMLRNSYATLVQLQNDLQEDVRFSNASVSTLKVKPGSGKDSLWETVRLWESYSQLRLKARESELQKSFRSKLLKYLQNQKKLKDGDLSGASIDISSLTPELQKDVMELQKRMVIELKPLALESTLALQKILEADTHQQRVKIVRLFVDAECRRLKAKQLIRGMFSSTSAGLVTTAEEEKVNNIAVPSSPRSSILLDEPDAFQ